MSKSSTSYTIYHNPRCSKSRAALDLLQERGIAPKVIEYLKTPPSVAELKSILKYLGLKPIDLVRKGESEYAERVQGKNLTDAQLVAAMVDNPILIERPIVIRGDRAVVGRPPENILQLLKQSSM